MKNYLYVSILIIGLSSCVSSVTQETISPTPGQQAMIDRKYECQSCRHALKTIAPRTVPHSFIGYGFINLCLKEQI